mgnify:CR=1 FL=1
MRKSASDQPVRPEDILGSERVSRFSHVDEARAVPPNSLGVSWSEPLTDPDAIGRAVRFVLAETDLFLNTSSDARLLPAAIEAGEGDLGKPSDAEMDADVERFGITPLFAPGALERI